MACLIYLLFSIISSFGIGAIERWSERGEAERRAPLRRAALPAAAGEAQT
jgi:hypothetical protein